MPGAAAHSPPCAQPSTLPGGTHVASLSTDFLATTLQKGSGIHLHKDFGLGEDLNGFLYLHKLLFQLSTVAAGSQ